MSNDATKQLTDGIKKTAQDELDIHSPSKWFEGIGSYVVQGLANGITGALGYVNDAMNKLVDATKLNGEEMANYGIDCGTSYVNGIISGLDSKWAELDNKPQNRLLRYGADVHPSRPEWRLENGRHYDRRWHLGRYG